MKYFVQVCSVVVAVGVALIFSGQAGPPSSLGIAAPQTMPALGAFTGLPEPATRASAGGGRIHAGTAGFAPVLPASPAAVGGRTSVAILGDLVPNEAAERERYLKMAVGELNLLRPEAVFTVGNLVAGMTRSGTRYAADAAATRGMLDELQVPWLPCVGVSDVVSGTRLSGSVGAADGDRRFEALYQRYVGPLYFSADVGGGDAGGAGGAVHAVVLDSEEGVGAGNTISDAQLQWLSQDLKRTFDGGRTQWVVVLLHRPLWRTEAQGGNWRKLHEMLVDFNRRPVATVEGFSVPGAARGPRVVGVFAGAERAMSQDPVRDGIRYLVVGPTAAQARAGDAPGESLRHFTLLKFDDADMRVALVRLGETGGGAGIVAEDAVTVKERAVLDAIAAWGEESVGVAGIVDERGEPLGRSRLAFHAVNRLSDAVDVQFRMAPGGWDFVTPPLLRRLAPGAEMTEDFSLRRIRAGTDHPMVQAAIFWSDARGRRHEIVLPRPIAVSPSIEVAASEKAVALDGNEGWVIAGSATVWNAAADMPPEPDPAIGLAADGDRLLVRVRVSDTTRGYWPVMKLAPQFGGIASDAVSVAWPSGTTVQRIWVVPFAPAGSELWTNTGIGAKQTELMKLDAKWGVQVSIKPDAAGYAVTLALPRKLVFEEGAGAQSQPTLHGGASINVAVHDNDESAMTWTKGWAREEAGPGAWARITLAPAAAAQTNKAQ